MASTRTFQGVTYTNGNCPASLLAPLLGNNWGDETAYLRKDAAASYNRARAEVLAKTGVVLAVRGWNRTLAEQEQFFHERYVPGLASADQRWHVHDGVGRWYGLKKGSAAAAIPGDSNHGWAIALDIVDFGGVGQWNHPNYLAAWPILAEHGWTETEGRGSIQEPWHKVYEPALDQHKNDPTPTEDDMVTAQDRQEIADAAAKAVWGYKFQAAQSDGARIPAETAGMRVLEARKDTDRTERLAAETTVLTRRVERLTSEVTLTSRALVTLAQSKGVDSDAIVAEVRAALENLTIEITTKEN